MAPAVVEALHRRWLQIEEAYDDSETDESDFSRLKEQWYHPHLPLKFPMPSLPAQFRSSVPVPIPDHGCSRLSASWLIRLNLRGYS
jgi:hypothetical protein